jgi:hypothetical protein
MDEDELLRELGVTAQAADQLEQNIIDNVSVSFERHTRPLRLRMGK